MGYIRFTWTFGIAWKNSAKAALVRRGPRLHQVQIAGREAVYTHTSKLDAMVATLGHDPNRVSVRTLDMEAKDEFIDSEVQIGLIYTAPLRCKIPGRNYANYTAFAV